MYLSPRKTLFPGNLPLTRHLSMFFSSSVSINILLLSSADNNRSIYRDELKKIHYKLPWKGTIPWRGSPVPSDVLLPNVLLQLNGHKIRLKFFFIVTQCLFIVLQHVHACFVSRRYSVSCDNKKYLSCPGLPYFNTLARLIGISDDSYVIGKSFHEFKSFSLQRQ